MNKNSELAPPKWLPPEHKDIWDRAVARLEQGGKRASYPAAVAVYKVYLKRSGRDRQMPLPGVGFDLDFKLAPDEAAIIEEIEREEAGSGRHMVDERVVESAKDPAANEEYWQKTDTSGRVYGPIEGLEGPFVTPVGRVLYYDPKAGAYYDPSTDIYVDKGEDPFQQPTKPGWGKESVTAPGWEKTVRKLKKEPGVDNPWALTWSMHNKGYTPGGKKGERLNMAKSTLKESMLDVGQVYFYSPKLARAMVQDGVDSVSWFVMANFISDNGCQGFPKVEGKEAELQKAALEYIAAGPSEYGGGEMGKEEYEAEEFGPALPLDQADKLRNLLFGIKSKAESLSDTNMEGQGEDFVMEWESSIQQILMAVDRLSKVVGWDGQ